MTSESIVERLRAFFAETPEDVQKTNVLRVEAFIASLKIESFDGLEAAYFSENVVRAPWSDVFDQGFGLDAAFIHDHPDAVRDFPKRLARLSTIDRELERIRGVLFPEIEEFWNQSMRNLGHEEECDLYLAMEGFQKGDRKKLMQWALQEPVPKEVIVSYTHTFYVNEEFLEFCWGGRSVWVLQEDRAVVDTGTLIGSHYGFWDIQHYAEQFFDEFCEEVLDEDREFDPHWDDPADFAERYGWEN